MDGAVCEITDHAAFARLLALRGVSTSRLARWEQTSGFIAGAIFFLAATLGLAFHYGLPAMAKSAADRLPPTALDTLSRRVFALNGLSVSYLAEILERIDSAHARAAGGSAAGPLGYVSSHRATAERLTWLRGCER